MIDRALYHHHQHLECQILEDRCSSLQHTFRMYGVEHWSCSGCFWWKLTKSIHDVFLFIYHLSWSVFLRNVQAMSLICVLIEIAPVILILCHCPSNKTILANFLAFLFSNSRWECCLPPHSVIIHYSQTWNLSSGYLQDFVWWTKSTVDVLMGSAHISSSSHLLNGPIQFKVNKIS